MATALPLEVVAGAVACGPPEACAGRLRFFIDAGASDVLLRFTARDEDEQLERAIEELDSHARIVERLVEAFMRG